MLYVFEEGYSFDTAVRGYYWSPLYHLRPLRQYYTKRLHLHLPLSETHFDNDIYFTIIRWHLNVLIKTSQRDTTIPMLPK